MLGMSFTTIEEILNFEFSPQADKKLRTLLEKSKRAKLVQRKAINLANSENKADRKNSAGKSSILTENSKQSKLGEFEEFDELKNSENGSEDIDNSNISNVSNVSNNSHQFSDDFEKSGKISNKSDSETLVSETFSKKVVSYIPRKIDLVQLLIESYHENQFIVGAKVYKLDPTKKTYLNLKAYKYCYFSVGCRKKRTPLVLSKFFIFVRVLWCNKQCLDFQGSFLSSFDCLFGSLQCFQGLLGFWSTFELNFYLEIHFFTVPFYKFYFSAILHESTFLINSLN